MPSCKSAALLSAMLLITSATAMAQPAETHSSQQQTSDVVASTHEHVREQNAKAWGLDTKEWATYESIMQGPRGYWSPGLDPLTALGIEAKTDVERTRYAQMQAKMEFERVEAELAYQRAYDAAFKRLYPNHLLIGDAEPGFLKNIPEPGLFDSRLTLFVSLNCPVCDAAVKRLMDTRIIDIYVVDSKGDDNAIRSWAAQLGIKPERVQQRKVTLNHNDTELTRITGKDSVQVSDLPIAFTRSGQSWLPAKL